MLGCLVGVAAAVDPPPDDGQAVLCMFTSWSAEAGPGDLFYPDLALFSPYQVCVVLYHLQGSTLAAFEFSLRLESGGVTLLPEEDLVMLDAAWCPDLGDVEQNGGGGFNFVNKILTPVPHVGEAVAILQVQLMFLDLPFGGIEPLYAFLEPADPPTVPGQMSYNMADQPGIDLVMVPNDVFCWNPPIHAVESRTWTDVKHLFD
jgi:hypothetical protein